LSLQEAARVRIDWRAEVRALANVGIALVMAVVFSLASAGLASLTRARAHRAMAPLREYVTACGVGDLETWAASRGMSVHRSSYRRQEAWPVLWALPDAPTSGARPCLVSLDAWPGELPFVLLAEREEGGVEAWDASDYDLAWMMGHWALAGGLWIVWLVVWRVAVALRDHAKERVP